MLLCTTTSRRLTTTLVHVGTDLQSLKKKKLVILKEELNKGVEKKNNWRVVLILKKQMQINWVLIMDVMMSVLVKHQLFVMISQRSKNS